MAFVTVFTQQPGACSGTTGHGGPGSYTVHGNTLSEPIDPVDRCSSGGLSFLTYGCAF